MEIEKTSTAFEVHDLRTASYALRKIKEWKEEMESNEALAADELKRITSWLESVNKPHVSNIEYYESLLVRYHSLILQEDSSKKTISTPYGKIKSTTRKASPKITDEETLMLLYPDYLVEQKPKFNWSEFKKKINVVEKENGEVVFLTEDGESVQGLGLDEENTTYKVVIE